MSELEPLVDPCPDCIDAAFRSSSKGGYCGSAFRCVRRAVYQARKEELTISGPEFYAQGFEAGVQAERGRMVEWLEEHSMTMSDNTVRVFIMKDEDWLMLKGESDAAKE